ncbi:uncharacterized protein Dere_GG26567 [Drosophila erecta]|uniref:Uncharacterized protein n=1 Tax=Drosophila erecta TaxID=7220 RepID=A0A0Q5W9E8_DROER|nr:uncharacterized protein Dere_GG26567 [Drosophila erecta]
METKPPRPGVTLLEMYAAENEVITSRSRNLGSTVYPFRQTLVFPGLSPFPNVSTAVVRLHLRATATHRILSMSCSSDDD